MDFETAKSQFMSFSQTISSDTDRYNFFQWLGKEVLPEFENQIGGPKDRVRRNSEGVLPATVMLDKIAGDIRARVPLEAVMPTESILHPTIGW